MNRKAKIFFNDKLAGVLMETERGYTFEYNEKYLLNPEASALSFTLPLSKKMYESYVLFAFFDGLIPEGWLLNIAEQNWKLNHKDRMGMLLACCNDCIGAVSVVEVK